MGKSIDKNKRSRLMPCNTSIQNLKLVPNIKWMGGPQGRLRKNLVTWIRFYSEIALKYWRPARDNWCKDGDSRGYTRTCGCKCVSPPYKKYLPAWGRLAAEFGDIKLQRDITNWLESQKVNYNSEVAFKYNVPMDQLSMTWYGYGTKVANYEDLSDSNSKSGWLSCAGKRAYCYLRDCPNNYWSSTTLCGDELFEIRKTNSVGSGGSGSGGRVVNGGRIFLQAGSNQFLNLYDCGDKHPMFLPPYPTTPVPGTNWWNTEPLGDWGFMSKPQALYISITQIWCFTSSMGHHRRARKGKRPLPDSPASKQSCRHRKRRLCSVGERVQLHCER